MKNEVEEWKPVIGYEGYYEVSNMGRIRSIPKVMRVKNKLGNFERIYGGKILKPHSSHGYLRIELNVNGKASKKMVHRMVAEAFIDNPFGYTQVNHKDEDKNNNCVDNLEWCNPKYNSNYGTRLQRLSVKNGKRIIQIKDGTIINEFHAIQEAERVTGISHSIIWRVCNGLGYTAGGYEWRYV